jgi:amino acid transporter
VGVLADPSANDRPLAEVGRQLFGPAGAAAASAGAVAVIVGVILVGLLAATRLLLALSDGGNLPAVVGVVHPRWRTPYVAILITGAAMFGLSVSGDLVTTITFSTAARVVCYILCCLALWKLASQPDAPAAQFPAPKPAVLAAISAALLVGVLVLGALKELPMLGGVLGLGLVLYGLAARRSGGAAASARAP